MTTKTEHNIPLILFVTFGILIVLLNIVLQIIFAVEDKKNDKEEYCLDGSCRVAGGDWGWTGPIKNCNIKGTNQKLACTTHCYNESMAKIRNYPNFLAYLKLSPDDQRRCLPTESSCDVNNTLVAPSRYYDLIGWRMNQRVNGCKNNPPGNETYDSNYVGAGTRTHLLTQAGFLPISVIDTLAIVHDYEYYFSCGEQDSITADKALLINIDYVVRKGWDTKDNAKTALTLLGIQEGLPFDITPGPSGEGVGWSNKFWQGYRDIAGQVLTSIYKSGIIKNWGCLIKYKNSRNIFNFINPDCSSSCQAMGPRVEVLLSNLLDYLSS